jgi:hypothetical protein
MTSSSVQKSSATAALDLSKARLSIMQTKLATCAYSALLVRNQK